jgi:hypothetical protein
MEYNHEPVLKVERIDTVHGVELVRVTTQNAKWQGWDLIPDGENSYITARREDGTLWQMVSTISEAEMRETLARQ